jgi:tRNA (mo5U34)-methyltransferase
MSFFRTQFGAALNRFKRWYHNIDLHGVLTNPTNPSYPETRWQLIKPYVPQDLTGKPVFDVGCNTGYFSIKMKQRDASVVGADCYNEGIEQARFVADVLALEIEYMPEYL